MGQLDFLAGQEIFSALYPEVCHYDFKLPGKGNQIARGFFWFIFLVFFYESSRGISLTPPLNDSPLLKQ